VTPQKRKDFHNELKSRSHKSLCLRKPPHFENDCQFGPILHNEGQVEEARVAVNCFIDDDSLDAVHWQESTLDAPTAPIRSDWTGAQRYFESKGDGNNERTEMTK
jgi:hypothetical protein